MRGASRFGILLIAARLFADPTVAIEGKVVDAGTGIPVGGATVSLRYSISPGAIRSTETGTDGTFRIEATGPGFYAFEASAPGYLKAVVGEDSGAVGLGDPDFQPGANKVVPPVTLKLMRAGAMSGHIRDAETAKPMRQVAVRALRAGWRLGTRTLAQEALVFSDADGKFHFEKLTPGEYIVEIQNQTAENSKPGKNYPLIFWPAQGPDTLAPFGVQPGESGVGTIDYAQVVLPKLQIGVANRCHDRSRPYDLGIAQRVGGAFLWRVDAAQSCGKPFEITTLAPGSYRLKVQVVDSNAPTVLYATADVDLAEGTEKNIELKPLSTVVSGRVVCDCEKPSEVVLEGIKVSIYSFGETGGWSSSMDIARDGTIPAMPCPIAGSAMVEVRGLPAGLAVKRMVFNGGESSLTLSPGSAATIEITLADRLASVSGSAPGTHVAIAAWPFVYPNFRSVETDKDRKFAFADLPPGDYRVVNVTAEQWERKDVPGVVAEWLAGAETITLGARESRTVDPGRE